MYYSLLADFTVQNPDYHDFIWKYSSDNPTLDEIRGKIVFLQNFSSRETFGISYGSFKIQDEYHLTTNWDLYWYKWEPIKQHIYKANASQADPNHPPFMNYLSGSGGSLPYFVASGHSSPGTCAPRLATGAATPFFGDDKYPDFPRVSCVGPFCTIAYEGTNILTYNLITSLAMSSIYFNGQPITYVGIVVADFPGKGLIDTIINVNEFKTST